MRGEIRRRVESCADEDKLRYRVFLREKNINDYTHRRIKDKKKEKREKERESKEE